MILVAEWGNEDGTLNLAGSRPAGQPTNGGGDAGRHCRVGMGFEREDGSGLVVPGKAG